jgi:hypothetical protein
MYNERQIMEIALCSFVALIIGAMLGLIGAGLCRMAEDTPPKNTVERDFELYMLTQGPREAWMVNHLRNAFFAGAQRGG